MDQIKADFSFFFDTEPSETVDEAYERLLCILDSLGIQWIGHGLPVPVYHDEDGAHYD